MCDQSFCTSLTKLVSIVIVLIFSDQNLSAQSFDSKINATHWTIDNEVKAGYSTDFGFSAKDVEKGWWRYSKEFGRPVNMKTYYRVTIPAEMNQGNLDLELFAKALSGKGGSTFFLTINDKQLSQTKKKDYLKQVKTILADFKQQYYLSVLEEKLKKEEKKAKKMSKRAEKADPRYKKKAFNALAIQEQKLEDLRDQIKDIIDSY